MTPATRAKAVGRKSPDSGSIRYSRTIRNAEDRGLRRSGRHVAAEKESASAPVQPVRHLARGCSVPLWKRTLDICGVLLSLPFTLPLMVFISLWIRLIGGGPALFRQERIGRNGKPFVLYKFRTMKTDADASRHFRHFRNLVRSDSPMVKLDLLCDKRLIPGGCFLRAAGLDELPQLFNVLRGEMSLVGPRPCLPEEFRFFTPAQRVRFESLPGLSGLWQVEGKGVSTFSEMNALDASYVRASSLTLDLGIIARTPAALLRQMWQAFQHRRSEGVEEPESAPSGELELTGISTRRPG